MTKKLLESINKVSKHQFESIEEVYTISKLIRRDVDYNGEKICRATDVYSFYFIDKNDKPNVFSFYKKETAAFDAFGAVDGYVPYEMGQI